MPQPVRHSRSLTGDRARSVGRSLLLLGWGAAIGLGMFSPPPAHAQLNALVPDQKVIPIEEFFEVLRDYGTWIDTDRYGTIFCPHPDVVGVDFQPYQRGHWTMSEFGWTFVSSSKISWVTERRRASV